MKTKSLIVLILLISSTAFSQIAPDKYFVRFTDKNNSPYSIDNPSAFLSQRAIERRQNQGIAIDASDLPVNPSYLQGVAAAGAEILNPSKWLNGVSVFADNPAVIDVINALPYVQSVTKSQGGQAIDANLSDKFEKSFFKYEFYNEINTNVVKQRYEIGVYDYGYGLNQIQMLKGDLFHEMGYRGQGLVIAVLDAGFTNVNNLSVFDSLWNNDQVLGTRDFVRGGEVQFDAHSHGTMVLSTMGGNLPGELIGTAPKASYWLLRSEDGATEYIIEEYNWVSAAEYADSVGADVINSSLGYTEFNDASQNHTYEDMDGDSAPATIGADMAAKKGILVVNSLGNEGGSSWYYLSAPSDGDSVLGIGAVTSQGIYASFSSHGPSYDGRVKPDVVAQGSACSIVDPGSGFITFGSGTSFSSPILAGMAACLWQANPSLTNMQIADAIRQSGSQYDTPDDFLGHGIPDFLVANDILTVIDSPGEKIHRIMVYPNPMMNVFTIDTRNLNGNDTFVDGKLDIFDLTGKLFGSQDINISTAQTRVNLLQDAPQGLYFIRLNIGGNLFTSKIIKD